MISIDPNGVTTRELYAYLTGAIAPRPIALASTISSDGIPNISPFSFFNVVSSNPPLLLFSVANKDGEGHLKDTLNNIIETSEVVINVVNYDMAEQISLSSADFSTEINEFEKSGFTPIASDTIKAFRVFESPVQIECKINEVINLGEERGAGNLILCNILKIHIKEEILDVDGKIDQHKIDVIGRLGADFYCRTNNSLFEIERPKSPNVIGFENLPQHIKQSNVLTGNDLAKLAGFEQIPGNDEIKNFSNQHNIKAFLMQATVEDIHAKAKLFLVEKDVSSAWKILLAK
ncbi:flavin reductase family protein [Zhouia sp. PK063]|uniref:flavin reductase family protein n=1 Tax=Zhouia sp. PK063 TaxID=3373602 RepID=UPI0037B16805